MLLVLPFFVISFTKFFCLYDNNIIDAAIYHYKFTVSLLVQQASVCGICGGEEQIRRKQINIANFLACYLQQVDVPRISLLDIMQRTSNVAHWYRSIQLSVSSATAVGQHCGRLWRQDVSLCQYSHRDSNVTGNIIRDQTNKPLLTEM